MNNLIEKTTGIKNSIVYTLAGAVLALIIAFSTAGINDSGERTVVQWPNGTTFVKFEEGMFWSLFGSTWTYSDVVSLDFEDKPVDAGDGRYTAGTGTPVRYQDGGTGTVYGVARFGLPTNEEDMLKTHRAFRSEGGLRDKMFGPLLREILNLTAGLVTSEEAYAEKRNEYSRWGEDQVTNGKYQTTLVERTIVVEPEELNADGGVIKKAVVRVQNIPEIELTSDGVTPYHGISPLSDYGISVTGFSLTDWTFEPKTLEQISLKRSANMAIITAQANASKAKQEKLQAIAEGQRNVATAQYTEEVEKAKQVVIAERAREVAVIAASQAVSVNEQNYLAGVQDVKAANEYAKAVELRTKADADARKRMILADGALTQKLEAYITVNGMYAQQFGKQKWVPELIMGAGGEGATGSAAADMISLLTTKTARDLSLDMSIVK
jgi:hypothetical protein